MKTAVIDRSAFANRPNLPYPNAATRREILRKAVDYLLLVAMGLAAMTVALFLLTLA